MPSLKETTILVAVLNKKDTIRNCVESLLKLKEAPQKIIVVDGYSKDGTYEILKEYEGKIDLYQYSKNLSTTLNWALDKINTKYTALTDGDCVVDSNWLNELLNGFEEENIVATAGYCGTPNNVSFFQKIIGLELEGRFNRLPKYILRAPTMNLCLKTVMARKVRFDEKQEVAVETDFGWRLSELGKIVYLPKAKVFHYHRAAFKNYFLQQKNQAEWGVRLLFKHGGKAINDPITTLSMTAQVPFLFFGLFFLLASLLFKLFLYPSIIFFFFLCILYLKNIIDIKASHNYYLGLFGLFFMRTFSWMIGIMIGLWNMIYNNKKTLLIFIFFASIFFCLIFLFFFRNIGPSEHSIPGSDYLSIYAPIADNIIQGNGVTLNGVFPVDFAVGFSIILSGIFSLAQFIGMNKIDLIIVFNVIFTAFSSCLLFLIANEFFSKRISLISSILWMTYPFNLWFIKNPNTEIFFIFFLYIGIFFYILTIKRISIKFSLLAGIFLGLSSAIRIISLFLPFFLALLLFIFLKKSSFRARTLLVVIILIGNLLVIFPWAIYSYSQNGSFIDISRQVSSGVSTGIIWLSESDKNTVVSNEELMITERIKVKKINNLTELSQFFIQEFKNDSLSLLKIVGLKITRAWYATSSAWYERETLIVQLIYLISSIFGLVYLIRKTPKVFLNVFPFLAIIFYFWAMAFFSVSIMRYMIPVMGLVIIFSSITINIILDKLTKKNICQS